ncbi:MAG: acyltransferase [Chthoniobacterales bacterium]
MFIDLYRAAQRSYAKVFTFLCRSSFGKLGHASVLVPPLRLWGEQRIEIGSGVFFGADGWLQVVPSDAPRGNEPVISIGDHTSIVGTCTITAVEQVVVERSVLMAGNVYISDHAHAHHSRTEPIKDQGVTNVAPVRICEGAWLGQNVVICPGVTVGKNSVIGANSVVRNNVPDFCVFAGAPAKFIRKIDERAPRSKQLMEPILAES